MHPLYSEYVAQTRQAELLREARIARAEALPRTHPARRPGRVRTSFGYWLVELGLRIAVQPGRRVRVVHSGPVR